jgi:hypothetical protein
MVSHHNAQSGAQIGTILIPIPCLTLGQVLLSHFGIFEVAGSCISCRHGCAVCRFVFVRVSLLGFFPIGRKSVVTPLQRGKISPDIVIACEFLMRAVMIRQFLA